MYSYKIFFIVSLYQDGVGCGGEPAVAVCTTTTPVGRMEWGLDGTSVYIIGASNPVGDFSTVGNTTIAFTGKTAVAVL